MFRELCGEKTLKNVILVTNMWGRVTPQQGADREQQLKTKHFKAAIEKGAHLCRHSNTPESARRILRTILNNEPVVLKIQHELIEERKEIGQTSAGEELNREIRAEVERYQNEIRELEENMRRAAEDMDEESREEQEEERRRLQEEMEKLRKDSEEMKFKFEEARREMEERIGTKFEERMRRIREEYEEEIRKYEDLVKELERDKVENASKITSLGEMVGELREKVNGIGRCIIM
jgi:chromosome segregation ATPase